MRKIGIFSFLVCFLPFNCFANDTAFGGSGAAPMPIKHENVVMLSEDITISGYEISRNDMKGYWEYNCDYLFKNESNIPLSFTMGFPFPINDELSEVAIPDNFLSKKGGALVYNFQLNIDGKMHPVTKAKILPNPDKGLDYEDAFIWGMKMLPEQSVKIHHYYISGVTINAMGQNYVSFVLKTGALWKSGVIHSAKFIVKPNTPTKLCSELDKSSDFLTPKPAGMKIISKGKNQEYVWDLRNFKPVDDLELCIINGKNYIRYYLVYPILQTSTYNGVRIKYIPDKDRRILRNSIYAQYGRRFQDAQLQAYFDKQWWYEKNPNYSDQLLTDEDKKVINLLN